MSLHGHCHEGMELIPVLSLLMFPPDTYEPFSSHEGPRYAMLIYCLVLSFFPTFGTYVA